ncbi:hypothetical protein M422DRAFT_247574 [Sphaerobolus stellatus SS14]|nr:hypothetical protein M422DRAFT_247574 [Sphaerobolus stellatus SS14]
MSDKPKPRRRKTKTQVILSFTSNRLPVKASNRRGSACPPLASAAPSSKASRQSQNKLPPPNTVFRNGRYISLDEVREELIMPSSADPGTPPPSEMDYSMDMEYGIGSDYLDDRDDGDVPASEYMSTLGTAAIGLRGFRSYWKQCQPIEQRKRRHATWPNWRTQVLPKVLQ